MIVAPGTVLAHRYRVVSPLGEGGLARAWLVRDEATGRDVCLKLLRSSDSGSVSALRREFELLVRLVHPALVRVHDFGLLDPPRDARAFLTSDVVRGVPITEFARGRSFGDVLPALADVTDALAFLHRAGLVHGDVKPDNVLVTAAGRAVLLDLSCARRERETGAGVVSGTPGFMAPEIVRGEPTDARADLYSLGRTIAALDEVLSERLPVTVRRLVDRLVADLVSPRPSDADEVLEALGVPRATRRAPPAEPPRLIGREAHMAELARALERLERLEAAPRVLVLTGERGAGRSRLLRELVWMAEARVRTVEGFAGATGSGGIRSLLARASGDVELPQGGMAAIAAWEKLAHASEPVLIALDGVEILSLDERSILEAFVRSVQPSGPVMIALTEARDEPEAGSAWQGAAIVEIEVGPFDAGGVAEWLSAIGSSASVADALRETSGFASDLVAWSGGAPAQPSERAGDIDRGAGTDPLAARVSALTPALRRAIAAICALIPVAPDDDLERLGIGLAEVSELVAAGLVVRRPSGLALSRRADLRVVAALAPVAQVHAELADLELGRITGERSDANAAAAARAARHLTLAGRHADAVALLRAHAPLSELAPKAWGAVAHSLSRHATEDADLLEIGEVLRACGRAHDAREVFMPLATSADDATACVALLSLAACAVDLDDARAALAQAQAAASRARTNEHRAAAEHAAARAYLRNGDYAAARAAAEPALGAARGPALLADLHEDVGVAATYLGDHAAARLHLAMAAGLQRDLRSPRRVVRALSYQAIDAYRSGDSEGALSGYRQALAAAEEHGLADQIARASLNVGTAAHARGMLGEALRCYERGALTATALGQADLAIVLEFNLAKLYADAGAFERAAIKAAEARAAARSRGLAFFVAAAESVLGDCALARGEAAEAIALFAGARDALERLGSRRDVVDEDLEMVRAELARGAIDAGRALLDRVREGASLDDAPDLGARAAVLSARLHLARAQYDDAVRDGEVAVKLAEASGQRDLQAAASLALADALVGAGQGEPARPLVAQAKDIWSAMAATLPEPMRDAFLRHPRRRDLRGPPAPAAMPEGASPERAGKLALLIALFRKLNTSLETNEILGLAMDAAVDLTGAERGFLLLDEPGRGPVVAVARNIDKERIGKSHLKFSRDIAERAIRDGEPVMTVDAQSDERFRTSASVHAMRLRSVIAVPIRSPDDVLGALYLDNRFGRARFTEDDLDLLQAFADQVALALRNAALVEELRRRTEELEVERARIADLARDQAEEIDRLAEEVKVRQEALQSRFDYGAIVGRSPAVRRVFAVLDRVVDSPITVLVTGESGTGKELVARAVHYASARKAGPFVGINCAALPSTLLESELFGHVRGAFTGADRDKPGLMAAARGGTLFLDEIGEMPLDMQAKLLRVLQEREVRPLGSVSAVSVDFRLVCATNRVLTEEVGAGRFREDLYFRVGVVEVALPPLRDRVEDLPDLCHHFARRAAEQLGRPEPRFAAGAIRKLAAYSFPGNVRELENIVMRAVVLGEGPKIEAHDIDLPAQTRGKVRRPTVDRARIVRALERTDWNVVRAAADLGVPRATFYRKLARFGIERP